MPRERDPRHNVARKIWEDSKERLTLREISAQIGVPEKTLSSWKSRDGWGKKGDRSTAKKTTKKSCKKKGAQPGNKNAEGNGRPPTHGLNSAKRKMDLIMSDPSKFHKVLEALPENIRETMLQVNGMNALDLLWGTILYQFAAIIEAQKRIHEYDSAADLVVKETHGLKGVEDAEKKYALLDKITDLFGQAMAPRDRAGYALAIGKAVSDLNSNVCRFIKLQGGLEDELMRTRVEKMQAEIQRIEADILNAGIIREGKDDKEINVVIQIPTEAKS